MCNRLWDVGHKAILALLCNFSVVKALDSCKSIYSLWHKTFFSRHSGDGLGMVLVIVVEVRIRTFNLWSFLWRLGVSLTLKDVFDHLALLPCNAQSLNRGLVLNNRCIQNLRLALGWGRLLVSWALWYLWNVFNRLIVINSLSKGRILLSWRLVSDLWWPIAAPLVGLLLYKLSGILRRVSTCVASRSFLWLLDFQISRLQLVLLFFGAIMQELMKVWLSVPWSTLLSITICWSVKAGSAVVDKSESALLLFLVNHWWWIIDVVFEFVNLLDHFNVLICYEFCLFLNNKHVICHLFQGV